MGAIKSHCKDGSRINSEYFATLRDLILTDKGEETYDLLIRDLYALNFYAVLPRDENRGKDGMDLRARYMGNDSDYITGPCSVLEMMIALSQRMSEIMFDPSVGDDTPRWFWEMIENLGLDFNSDSRYSSIFTDQTIRRFLDRKYDADGLGGLFPLEYPGEDIDQRDIEIWYQMQSYLNERY